MCDFDFCIGVYSGDCVFWKKRNEVRYGKKHVTMNLMWISFIKLNNGSHLFHVTAIDIQIQIWVNEKGKKRKNILTEALC